MKKIFRVSNSGICIVDAEPDSKTHEQEVLLSDLFYSREWLTVESTSASVKEMVLEWMSK